MSSSCGSKCVRIITVEGESCFPPVDRVVYDFVGAVVGANRANVPATSPALGNGSSDPGAAAHQAWIDANVDYNSPSGVQSDLDLLDVDPSGGVTDGAWIDFLAVIPEGGATLSWEATTEGYARIEVDECNCDTFELVDEIWSPVGTPTVASVTLAAGLHRVRVTNVDSGGSASDWAYTGDTFPFYSSTQGTQPTYSLQQLYVDCDGNYFANNDGTGPVAGSVSPVGYGCPLGEKVKAEDVFGLVDMFGTVGPAPLSGNSTNGVTFAPGDIITTFPDGTVHADPPAGSWSQVDYTSGQTINDGVGDRVHRLGNVGAQTFTIDSAAYAPGARLVVSNIHLNTGDLTLAPDMIGNGPGGVETVVIPPGHNVTIVRQTGGAWMVTSSHPDIDTATSGVQSVTGDFVDNTDPLNPVLDATCTVTHVAPATDFVGAAGNVLSGNGVIEVLGTIDYSAAFPSIGFAIGTAGQVMPGGGSYVSLQVGTAPGLADIFDGQADGFNTNDASSAGGGSGSFAVPAGTAYFQVIRTGSSGAQLNPIGVNVATATTTTEEKVCDLIANNTAALAEKVDSVTGEHVDNSDPLNPVVLTWIKEECFDTNLVANSIAEDDNPSTAGANNTDTNFTAPIDGTISSLFYKVQNDTGAIIPSQAFAINGPPAAVTVDIPVGASIIELPLVPPRVVTAGETVNVNPLNNGNFQFHDATGPSDFFHGIANAQNGPIQAGFDEDYAPLQVKVRTYDDGSTWEVDEVGNTIAPYTVPAGAVVISCFTPEEEAAIQQLITDSACDLISPEVGRTCTVYTTAANSNVFNNSDLAPGVDFITSDLTFDLVPTQTYVGNSLVVQMFGGNGIPIQETYVLQIVGGSINASIPITLPIGSGNLAWDISGLVFEGGVTYSCTIANSTGDGVRIDAAPDAANFVGNTSLAGGAIPISIFNGAPANGPYEEIEYLCDGTTKTLYVSNGVVTETAPTGTRTEIACPLSATEIAQIQAIIDATPDPASTEEGNLTIVGDDGEEFSLPLQSEQCYRELVDTPLAGSLFTLDNFDGTPTVVPPVVLGTSQTFYNPDKQVFFDLAELPFGARIKEIRMHDFRAGNNTAAITHVYNGTATNAVSAADHPNGLSPAPRSWTFATSELLVAGVPLLVSNPTQNTTDQGPGLGSAWIASITPGTATASGGANDGVTTSLDGFNATVDFELSETNEYTVRTYSDGETTKQIYFDAAGDPIEITAIPATWELCPEEGLNATELAEVQELIVSSANTVTATNASISNGSVETHETLVGPNFQLIDLAQFSQVSLNGMSLNATTNGIVVADAGKYQVNWNLDLEKTVDGVSGNDVLVLPLVGVVSQGSQTETLAQDEVGRYGGSYIVDVVPNDEFRWAVTAAGSESVRVNRLNVTIVRIA